MTPTEDLPALLGGRPIRAEGPPEWPAPDEAVCDALLTAYANGSWGKYHGANVPRLSECLAEYFGVPEVLLCGSGTFAVDLALRALKVGPGDEILLGAYDYPGNFLTVHALGAMPVLVDLDPANWNLDATRLEEAVGPATRAILVSHLHGGLVPMREVMALAARHGLRVVEDAAQVPGAVVQGRKAGTWGDVGVLSFGGSKLLTAGRGGALLTSYADGAQRARAYLHRGNLVCPLSELQAAVLLPQVAKLDERNARRAAAVARLAERLAGVRGLKPFQNPGVEGTPAYYKLGFQFDAAAFGGLPRERFVAAARAEGVAFDEGFRALHVGRSPKRFRKAGDLRVAEQAHAGCVVLHHPVLLGSEADVDRVAGAVQKLYAFAGRLASPT
jgi:perosamine synthetase